MGMQALECGGEEEEVVAEVVELRPSLSEGLTEEVLEKLGAVLPNVISAGGVREEHYANEGDFIADQVGYTD